MFVGRCAIGVVEGRGLERERACAKRGTKQTHVEHGRVY